VCIYHIIYIYICLYIIHAYSVYYMFSNCSIIGKRCANYASDLVPTLCFGCASQKRLFPRGLAKKPPKRMNNIKVIWCHFVASKISVSMQHTPPVHFDRCSTCFEIALNPNRITTRKLKHIFFQSAGQRHSNTLLQQKHRSNESNTNTHIYEISV